MSVGTLQSFNDNTLTDQLAGPIGIVKMADQFMLDQIKGILILFIMISLFVGIFNLFPIPLLDGGHIFYFTIVWKGNICVTFGMISLVGWWNGIWIILRIRNVFCKKYN